MKAVASNKNQAWTGRYHLGKIGYSMLYIIIHRFYDVLKICGYSSIER